MAIDFEERRAMALGAVRETARLFGLSTADARVLKDSNNTVVLLPAERLVAKVSTSTLEGRGASALERELMLGQRLAERGVPIAPPAGGELAGPHHAASGIVLTYWRYLPSRERPPEGDRLLGPVLGQFHVALSDLAAQLPRLADKVELAHRLLQDAAATPRLTTGDRRLAARAHDKLVALLAQLGQTTVLHSEPHDGNILWTADGPALIDFEAACTGPLEWDLAYLPTDALGAFPDHDDRVVTKLRAGVSFCVAAWCNANPDRAPDVASAATFHLGALMQSWLAADCQPASGGSI